MANRSTDSDRALTRVAAHEWSPEWFGLDPVEWADELARKRMRFEIRGGCSNVDVSLAYAENDATTWQPEVAR